MGSKMKPMWTPTAPWPPAARGTSRGRAPPAPGVTAQAEPLKKEDTFKYKMINKVKDEVRRLAAEQHVTLNALNNAREAMGVVACGVSSYYLDTTSSGR